eukprot:TRINITY_DN857_c0_g1_i5.p1 TRINITY_DN857_c0_g1~~TRINITY_DN857_c0_g1_i5.p1  ORF type:complete len:1163 (-),score=343.93 TRINITY_DN857_c0_g1_i5:589-3927(-)
MICELEECNEICIALFHLMFKIVNDEHSSKVKKFILDVLCPLISDSDGVSNELLDVILTNVVEPVKSQRKYAYNLARELIIKTSEHLEPYIQQFFNHVLILGKDDDKLFIKKKVYDLIYELNHICPSILLAVLPQLEFKIKSTDEKERMGSVALLAKMFSEPNSTLAARHKALWQVFLGRFNDISVKIRIKCVQYTMHFLLNHPKLRGDITEALKARQHDPEENVRFEVVVAIFATAKKDFEVVSSSEDLLNVVKERTLDKKFKIRKEAMEGLALIYYKHLTNPEVVPDATKNAVKWIKDKILYGYYTPGIDNRLLVEKLMVTKLVPYTLDTVNRMKKMYILFGTIDPNATKAFIEMQRHQWQVRKSISDLVHQIKLPASEERNKMIASMNNTLSKFLPEPVKALENIKKFSLHLVSNMELLKYVEKFCDPYVTCKESVECLQIIYRQLGTPNMANIYLNTVKKLMERGSSVIVDADGIWSLVQLVQDVLKNGETITELDLDPDTAGEKGLRLLFVLTFTFPAHFNHKDTIKGLLNCLDAKHEYVAPLVLASLSFIGKFKPISEIFPDLHMVIRKICNEYIRNGTPKEAKHAIRCLYANTKDNIEEVFSPVLEIIKENLNGEKNRFFLTAIVALGHLAFYIPDKFRAGIKNLISRKIVKDLMMNDLTAARGGTDTWADYEDLCLETQCKLEGFKLMARWLLGLKTDTINAQKTFRMLNAIIENGGDLLEKGKPNPAERAWLRLGAGCAILKICEQKGVGDMVAVNHMYNLAELAADPVPQVREKIIKKLHKGFKSFPYKSLPLDFMGIYVLSGFDEDKKLKMTAKSFLQADINKRSDYVKSRMLSGGDSGPQNISHQLADYMLVFVVAILAHHKAFSSLQDVEHLKRIRQALWFVLEPLITKNENYSYPFYQDMIQKIKNCSDALNPDDETANHKIYAVCDLANGIVHSRSKTFARKPFLAEPTIPVSYYKLSDNPSYQNTQVYVPEEILLSKGGVGGGLAGTSAPTSAAAVTTAASTTRTTHASENDVEDRITDGEDGGANDDTGSIDNETASSSSNITSGSKRSLRSTNNDSTAEDDTATTITMATTAAVSETNGQSTKGPPPRKRTRNT